MYMNSYLQQGHTRGTEYGTFEVVFLEAVQIFVHDVEARITHFDILIRGSKNDGLKRGNASRGSLAYLTSRARSPNGN